MANKSTTYDDTGGDGNSNSNNNSNAVWNLLPSRASVFDLWHTIQHKARAFTHTMWTDVLTWESLAQLSLTARKEVGNIRARVWPLRASSEEKRSVTVVRKVRRRLRRARNGVWRREQRDSHSHSHSPRQHHHKISKHTHQHHHPNHHKHHRNNSNT